MELRRLKAAKGLLTHSLFDFQVHDTVISERLSELKEFLLATCGERDQIALLSENIREIEEQLQSCSERFLLEPLKRFEQDMVLLLDVWSGDDLEEEDEDVEDDKMEECLLSSQDSLVSMPTQQSSSPSHIQPIPAHQSRMEDEEMRCGVCWAHNSLENDPMVICDICGVAVHQTCYRLAEVPEGDWYCIPCRQHIGWVHVACSMFLPELYIQNNFASRCQEPLQVVCGVDNLKARRKLRCCFCKKNNAKGACAQCAVGKCTVAYHALCALQNGIKLRYLENQGHFGSGCLKHQVNFLKMDTLDKSGVANTQNLVPQKENGIISIGSRKLSWSQNDSEDVTEDNDDLGSDSDRGSCPDSLLNDDGSNRDESHKYLALPSSSRQPLGASLPRNCGKQRLNKPKCKRQIKLSFASANDRSTLNCRSIKVANAPLTSSSSTYEAAVDSTLSYPQYTAASEARNADADSNVVIRADVFAPLFYPSMNGRDCLDDRSPDFVMILIHSRPLGLGVASSKHGTGIFLHAEKTRNLSVIAALKRGVLQDGDEIYALNELSLRNTEFRAFKEEVVPSVSLPVRCWFRKIRKKKDEANHFHSYSSDHENAASAIPINSHDKQIHTSPATASSHFEAINPTIHSRQDIRDGDATIASLGIDWPWIFLRSDGKVAMKLFWKSLDSAFFLRNLNKRTLSQLQEATENLCGLRLRSSHPEYEEVRKLLQMPRCERIPAFIMEFRKNLEQKQKLFKPDVLKDVSSEPNDAEGAVGEQSLLEVGTTVNVAKRTWPGMNKLGGVGRIKKVNKIVSPNGKLYFTYNITYVLSGAEKNVERKYISVVDFKAREIDKSEVTSSASTSRRHKSEEGPEDGQKTKADTKSARLIFKIRRTTPEDQLTDLTDSHCQNLPSRQRFRLRFSIDKSTLQCERMTQDSGVAPPAQELLLHRHFPVKVTDALVNEYFSALLLSVEDRIGDEVDDSDSDSENKSDEIKTELTTLQNRFCSVMESNKSVFSKLAQSIEKEYASKVYRQQELESIEWRNYERMYQELFNARRQFADSDEDGYLSGDGQQPDAFANTKSTDGTNSDNEDISFGGMFVNKLKEEGSEVCALCELSGGDFTRTECGNVVHPQCALFTPETFFKDGVVHGMNLIDPQRRLLKCIICGGRKGQSKIQCAHRKCVRAYHVSCAFVSGLLTQDPYYQAWCPRHLKISRMGQFVELPDHVNKYTSPLSSTTADTLNTTLMSNLAQRSRKINNCKDARTAEATNFAQADISSSKLTRKRKRNDSIGGSGNKDTRVIRSKSRQSAIAHDDEEPRCARRLDIELSDDSDQEKRAVDAWQQGRDPQHIFSRGNVVEVLARDWRGINKPGGVARIRGVEMTESKSGAKDIFYDVVHIVGAFREKRVPAKFIRSYQHSNK
ncbi:PHD finger protein [Plasmopara halstedii]|uniref:PHD finger protein n=1 Tax=Plasmopara halstedii TaxID=4781 RepID=A0A0N7L8F5_PLAHL|nr:PHD finger protein [Plasmopara halstedii]CEG49731.1 PHD finger protein [Plasmopara halstedii]|eukprot:XP_024586100.1 PHD finger protein [Plasmopara halstedii]